MAQTLFSDYEGRLKLDNELMRMRGEFDKYKERLRQMLIKTLQGRTAERDLSRTSSGDPFGGHSLLARIPTASKRNSTHKNESHQRP